MCIIGLSIELMYKCHYYIKNKYDDKVKLLLTDTDSFTYVIENKNVYDELN